MAFTHTITLDKDISGIATGDIWYSGTTEDARLIHQENLTIDFTITSLTFNCTSVVGISGTNPAILRIYQSTQPSMAAMLEVSGTGQFTSTINLDVTAAQGSTRTLVIDAYDPDGVSPNNTCSFTGTISVTGAPKIDTAG